jgi:hypothetical protein
MSTIKIEVLGMGCKKCQQLEANAKDAIAGAHTAKKNSGCSPVNLPNIAAISSGSRMKSPKIPQAKPKVISRNGMIAMKGI